MGRVFTHRRGRSRDAVGAGEPLGAGGWWWGNGMRLLFQTRGHPGCILEIIQVQFLNGQVFAQPYFKGSGLDLKAHRTACDLTSVD